ncbi:hypothetical protein F5B22DRAFT_30833 [Xylaria bambusicola]|uniref:uncharacterized protein n=1 Tax=Xylaria bambusicola TaxID=326684 RepID=UPI002008E911|nr:uncharacterized protein F5B22DRAFT_30833 [Xylaria bambusicola]KAI0528315.1 hypothetical protein F5B22DRAFT_30833 [Xylaria bambusicola]
MRAFMVCRNFSSNGGMLTRHVVSVRGSSPSVSHMVKRQTRGHESRSTSTEYSEESSEYVAADSLFSRRSIISTSSSRPQSLLSKDYLEPRSSFPTPIQFKNALATANSRLVHDLLQNSFHEIATDEYEWLLELQILGYSAQEIADILLEKSCYGPCVFAELQIPDVEGFVDGLHQEGCVHYGAANSEAEFLVRSLRETAFQTEDGEESNKTLLTPLESIQYFCGVGGVKPTHTGQAELLFGFLSFEDYNTTAISSLNGDHATENVLSSLGKATGILQLLHGCCDSFTFLLLQSSCAELVRMNLGSNQSSNDIPVDKIFPKISNRLLQPRTLAAQFLSLAFLSYSQAHCGDIRPFFLDTPLKRVILMGDQRWSADFDGPCIVGSLVELSCFGDMLRQPVFAFQCLDQYRPEAISEKRLKVDLVASPEDILDTWGPGGFMAPINDKENLYAISIGGGLITPVSTNPVLLHWDLTKQLDPHPTMTFHRTKKVRIGAKVSRNDNCQAKPQEQLTLAFSMLEELGTYPSYWEVSERQLGFGLQAGQSTIAFIQFNQTWVKRCGMTKKSRMLAQKAMYIADLEGYFGIQVSVCTGIARRVRLRDLLADVLPAYVGALVAKPPGWKSLMEDFNILQALKESNLSTWLESLDSNLQKTFESLVLAILFLLQDTGVDRKGENFTVGCIQPDIPFQCFNIPCRSQNYWARMVADSEDIATFAYVTTQCLETDVVKCQGSDAHWANSTALLWTAVSCYEEERQAATANTSSSSAAWTLKHMEAYLIGKPEAPLLVQVDRRNDHEEPCLLVSVSSIRSDILRRLYRKASSSKLKRLRERGAFNQIAEDVVVLASTSGRRLSASLPP